MRKALFSVVLLLGLIIQPVAFANNAFQDDDSLSWFPYAHYDSISYYDYYDIADAETLPFFNKLFRSLIPAVSGLELLPASFKAQILSCTYGKIKRIKIKRLEIGDIPPDKKGRRALKSDSSDRMIINITGDADAEFTILQDVGSELYVFSCMNLQELLKNALKNGEIILTDFRILDRPVFAIRGKNPHEQEPELYLFATDNQELLATEKLPLLTAMVKTGNGLWTRMIDDEAYIDLLDIVPRLGNCWRIYPLKAQKLRKIEKMRKENRPENEIEAFEREGEEEPDFSIKDFVISDERIVDRSIGVFPKEEFAEGQINDFNHATQAQIVNFAREDNTVIKRTHGLAKAKRIRGKHYINIQLSLAVKLTDPPNSNTERDGNWLIDTIIWDSEAIENYMAAEEEREKRKDK